MSIRPFLIFLLGLSVFALLFWGSQRWQQKKYQSKPLIVVSSHNTDWQKTFISQMQQAVGNPDLEIWEGIDRKEAFLSRWQSRKDKPEPLFIALGPVAIKSVKEGGLGADYYGVQGHFAYEKKQEKESLIGALSIGENYDLFLQNLKRLFPQINKWALVLSKSYPPEQLEAFIEQAYFHHLSIQQVKIIRFSELYLLSRIIDYDAQGILVLEDEEVLEGFEKLVKASKKRALPLVTLEPLTVLKGADLAIGISVKEQLKQLLEDLATYKGGGKKLPIKDLESARKVWVNMQSLQEGRVRKENLQQLSLPLQYLD